MKIWLIQDGEPLPNIDPNTREWRTSMLANALVHRGHNVLWWASTFDHIRKHHRFNSPKTVDLNTNFQLRLLHAPSYNHNKSPMRFLHHRILAKQYAYESVNCDLPDLIFCSVPTLELAEQSVKYGNQNHIPVLVDIRDPWPDIYLNLFPKLMRKFARIFFESEFRRIRFILNNAHGIIAVSNTYLEWALEYTNRLKTDADGIFPLGYESKYILSEEDKRQNWLHSTYNIKTTSIIVTFIGTFGDSYDLETLIYAAHRIQKEQSINVHFMLVGDGDKASHLHRMASNLTNLTFTGWLDQAVLQQVMHATDIALASYNKDALQSLPNKPFEYISAGLPLLSSLSGELEQLIKRYHIGLQYEASNVSSLVEQITWFINHPDKRIEMGQRANKLFNEQFRSDIIYPKLATHLENVAASM